MAKTGPGSAHRHQNSRNAWSDLTDVASGSTHTHDLDLSGYATDAELAALDARLKTVEQWVAAHSSDPVVPPVEPPVTPPVTPPVVPPTTTGAYGTGLSGDSRNNHQIGWTNRAKLDYRFRARGGTVQSVRFQERGGPSHDAVPTYGYSWGNGGTIRASIQSDNGAGLPSGNILGSVSWSPGNPAGDWEVWTLHSFPSPFDLTPGGLYHLVAENVAADPVGNYISFNMLFHYGSTPTPRNAAFTDDFAALYAAPSTWQVQVSDVPIFDLAYANGQHDGQAYIGTLADKYGLINGGQSMARERFTVSGGDRTVSKAHVRCRRISGTGPLTITLEKADRTVLASATVASSQIATGALPGPGAALQGDTWAHVTFPAPAAFINGQAYALRLSTDASTTYTVVPIQQGTSKGLASRVFADGDGQRTTDGGANWSNLYPYDSVDLQFWVD